MDRFATVECDVRRHGPRAAARAAQHAQPPDGRSHLQSDGAARAIPTGASSTWNAAMARRANRRSSRSVSNPQRLDNLEGKILRIIPDLNEHVATSTVSENGRYRIPNDNPFVSTPGARKEIWAYGFRNPHRLNWAVDPANPANNRLIANSVGLQHVGDGLPRSQRRQLRLRAARGQRAAQRRQQDRAAAARSTRFPLQIGDKPTGQMVRRSIQSFSTDTDRMAATRSAAVSSTTARRFPRFAASTSSPTSPPAASGTPTTRTCWRRTTASPARWRRCTR